MRLYHLTEESIVIHYTLQGPTHTLEIHDDKIRLKRRVFSRIARGPSTEDFALDALSDFAVSIPQYILFGKLDWKTMDGKAGTFRFSTNASMVEKIEKYMQKVIQRNQEKVQVLKPKPKIDQVQMAA
jgi:hypothetical protein